MNMKRALRNFRVDRRNGKVLGVCAGIANQTGWDVTFVRVGIAVLMIAIAFPWLLVPYAVAGFIGRQRSSDDYGYGRMTGRPSEEDLAEARAMTARAAEIESCVASENSSLAREIEKLRQA
jgi:phage shock protein C